MPFIDKAEKKKETKSLGVELEAGIRDDLGLYAEFVGKPTGRVVEEILRKVFETDEEFVRFKAARPVRQRRQKSSNVETMPEPKPEAQSA
jgi:hypothetical protein